MMATSVINHFLIGFEADSIEENMFDTLILAKVHSYQNLSPQEGIFQFCFTKWTSCQTAPTYLDLPIC